MNSPLGKSILRVEDERLMKGEGQFVGDINYREQAYAAFVRSTHSHAKIAALDITKAVSEPGVLAVLTGRDYRAGGLKPIPLDPVGPDQIDLTRRAFSPEDMGNRAFPALWPLVDGEVRHVGEIIAMVVASSEAEAIDACEKIEVEYVDIVPVVDARQAAALDSPRAYLEWPDNLAVMRENGDRVAVEAAIARADHVFRLGFHNKRLYGAPMELRGATALYENETRRYLLHSTSQGVHRQKAGLVGALGVSPDRVRVVTGDVGGGFGVRTPCYPEYPLLLWASRRVGRPVKWTSSRQELFVSDYQARDVHVAGTLALDGQGRIIALQFDYLANLGAYAVGFSVLSNVLRMAGGPYAIPNIHVRARGVLTNTVPIMVYRGAGRPEATAIIERLVDIAAAQIGIDRVELRRRNLIPPSALPYRSPAGHLYDSGAFEENLDRVLAASDWAGFASRRSAALKRGRLAGIGLAMYLESPTGAPNERADIRIVPEGRVEARVGTQSSGQGHETAFGQVVAAYLQLPMESVSIIFGDSDVIASGGGSHSDRSLRLGGTAFVRAADTVLEMARTRAASHLEVAREDLHYVEGTFRVVGTDRAISLFDLANDQQDGPLAAGGEVSARLNAHPNGAVVCEVEIDPDTGRVDLVRYTGVDDVGRLVNPMLVEGQIHGGIAQGIGQAMLEECIYDNEGQLLTGSFLDYALPRANDVPPMHVRPNEVPAASNPLGVKGAGECGITPSPVVVINAIVDALSDLGVTQIEMPATPGRIWAAIGNRNQGDVADDGSQGE